MDPSNDERMRREDELRGRVAEESLALPVGDSAAPRSEEGETQRCGDELRTRWTLHAVQADFVSCRERFSLYIGGIGSGKTWAVAMRAVSFERTNVRPGEKSTGALVVFQASEVREATADERKALQEARKAQKLQAKQHHTQRQAEKQTAKAQSEQQSA